MFWWKIVKVLNCGQGFDAFLDNDNVGNCRQMHGWGHNCSHRHFKNLSIAAKIAVMDCILKPWNFFPECNLTCFFVYLCLIVCASIGDISMGCLMNLTVVLSCFLWLWRRDGPGVMKLRCGMAASNGSVKTLKVILLRMVLFVMCNMGFVREGRVKKWCLSICQLCRHVA